MNLFIFNKMGLINNFVSPELTNGASNEDSNFSKNNYNLSCFINVFP